MSDLFNPNEMDDLLSFMDDENHQVEEKKDKPWKVMIVDDDESVHQVTRLILSDMIFKNKPIEILSAYDGNEARKLVLSHDDIALILLDVVMESEDTGLKLVKFIREVAGNKRVRIILRTGQPGQAPERKVIVEYDINDYKLKTELTADKLFVSVVAALRAFHDMDALEHNGRSLEKILESSARLFKERQQADFMINVYSQLLELVCLECEKSHIKTSGLVARISDHGSELLYGSGKYHGCETAPWESIFSSDQMRHWVGRLHKPMIYDESETFSLVFNDKQIQGT